MAAYRVQDKVVTLEVAFQGYLRYDGPNPPPAIPPEGEPDTVYQNDYTIEVGLRWASPPDVNPKLTFACGPHSVPGTALRRKMTATALAFVASDSNTYTDELDGKNLISGTATISADVEEWMEILDDDDEDNAEPEPDSAVVTDNRHARVWLRLKSGGTLTCEVVTSDVSASVTDTIASPNDVILTDYELYIKLSGGGRNSSQDARATIDYHGYELPDLYVKSDSTAQIKGENDKLYVITTGNGYGRIWVTGQPTVTLDIDGHLRADVADYPFDSTVRVKAKVTTDYDVIPVSAGVYEGEIEVQQYSVDGEVNGMAQEAVSAAEWTPMFWHWLVAPEADPGAATDLEWRGWEYEIGEIVQEETIVVDGGFSFGDSGTTRTLDPAQSWRGYRHLVVDTGQALKTVQLTVGAKQFTVLTTAGGLARFDLCGPSNLTASTDARDTIWPEPTDVNTVSGDGCMWGVEEVGAYTLTAEAGVTCTVGADDVYLSRDTWNPTPPGHSLLNVCPAEDLWYEDGVGYEVRPFGRGDTDGRRSLDTYDLEDTGVAVQEITIQDWLALVNDDLNTGWTATIDAAIDVADGATGTAMRSNYLNRNRPATWIEGAGIRHSDGEFAYGLDLDCNDARTLKAQVMADKLTLYPICGDVFGIGPGDTDENTILLRSGRYMRAAAWGLTLHENGIAHSGATVTQKELPDLTAAGYGNSDIRGEYLTGSPWGRAGYDHRIQPQVGAASAYIDRMLYGGTRLRSCFTVVPASLGCIEADGPRAWLHIGYGKRIRTYNLWGWDIVQESAEYTVESWLKLRTDPRRGSLHMLSDDGAGVLGVWASYDGGMTGTEVATVTATSAAIEVDSERGAYVCLYENGGNVKVQQSGDGGSTWTAATDALYLGAAFAGTVIDMARDARRDVMLLALASGGAISVYGSQDLGLTWELVAS